MEDDYNIIEHNIYMEDDYNIIEHNINMEDDYNIMNQTSDTIIRTSIHVIYHTMIRHLRSDIMWRSDHATQSPEMARRGGGGW